MTAMRRYSAELRRDEARGGYSTRVYIRWIGTPMSRDVLQPAQSMHVPLTIA